MVSTFHFGSSASNGMIAHEGILRHGSVQVSDHAVSSICSDGSTVTEPAVGSPQSAVNAASVDSSINIGCPLKGPGAVPWVHASLNSSKVTPSVTVGNGTTSAYTHWICISFDLGC